MKVTLKNSELVPLDILIDFFAFLYDSVSGFMKFLVENCLRSLSKIKKRPLELLIDFFAFLYDLVYYFIARLTIFFAFQYDLVSDFTQFFKEYIKWITDIASPKIN